MGWIRQQERLRPRTETPFTERFDVLFAGSPEG